MPGCCAARSRPCTGSTGWSTKHCCREGRLDEPVCASMQYVTTGEQASVQLCASSTRQPACRPETDQALQLGTVARQALALATTHCTGGTDECEGGCIRFAAQQQHLIAMPLRRTLATMGTYMRCTPSLPGSCPHSACSSTAAEPSLAAALHPSVWLAGRAASSYLFSGGVDLHVPVLAPHALVGPVALGTVGVAGGAGNRRRRRHALRIRVGQPWHGGWRTCKQGIMITSHAPGLAAAAQCQHTCSQHATHWSPALSRRRQPTQPGG